MEIDTSTWKEYRIGDLFDISRGQRLIEENREAGNIPYFSASESNNGMTDSISNPLFVEKDALIYSTFGDCYYVRGDFTASDEISILKNPNMNESSGLFLATILTANKYKYQFGRKAFQNKFVNEIIKIPATSTGEPDWQYMEDFMGDLHSKPITTSVKSSHIPLETEKWKEYKLEDVFILKSGFYNKKPEHSIDGNIPFLASTESNNGTTEYYNIEDIKSWNKVGNEDNTLKNKIYDGNCIAVTVNGSVCNAFYQKDDFACSHDITALYLKNHIMTSNIAMFLCTIIMKDKYRWSYGRKPHDVKKFGKSIIKLPAISTGEPDWQYMEDYIKSLPYGDKLGGFC